MVTLDHVVVHCSNDTDLTELREDLAHHGIPFEPRWGKKAKGFRISNIWIGRQYFELVHILGNDNAWQPQWSARHARGDRGVYCVFVKTGRDLDELTAELVSAGIEVSEPERTRFSWFFGLLEKRMPWRFVLVSGIPGTSIEIGIIRYDEGAEDRFKPYMVPNAEDSGFEGLIRAFVETSERDAASDALTALGAALGDELPITMVPDGTFGNGIDLRLIPAVSQGMCFSSCRVENVEISLDTRDHEAR